MTNAVTPAVLRDWGLPDPGDSKKARGDVIVVGGSRRTPGGAMLAGVASLRVGAGRLAVYAPGSIDAQLGAVLPEAAVFALPEDASDPFPDPDRARLSSADAVLVGPGFDDPDETRDTLLQVAATNPHCVVLDAYALGILPQIDRDDLPAALLLTPNKEELALLLDTEDVGDDLTAAVRDAAARYRAAVTCYGVVAGPDGATWRVHGGGPGLGTSGSGDVMAGAVAGFAARGVDPVRAAAWGTWVHTRAGNRLTQRFGLGFLARELAAELPLALREVA
ncbi:MAG: NAD(P)H-hydrate dehydratase [Microbacterium sp.]|uniref:NAD(P)H-hydrate dehydratase n=1 Tax=Microbacterium sp. TaxID=51671 RepID=UPI00262C423E|nr:NAD(P)H-hydrate dehydratase [Microbacterium sp.]MCX6502340.1 NAD(P)H-hydrate dehydratase [Microbacterium sp.]